MIVEGEEQTRLLGGTALWGGAGGRRRAEGIRSVPRQDVSFLMTIVYEMVQFAKSTAAASSDVQEMGDGMVSWTGTTVPSSGSVAAETGSAQPSAGARRDCSRGFPGAAYEPLCLGRQE